MFTCDDKTDGKWQEVPKEKSSEDFYFTVTESHIFFHTLHSSRLIVLIPPTLRTMIFGRLDSTERECKLTLEVHLLNNEAELKEVRHRDMAFR